MDQEIQAMASIAKALEELSDEAQKRVLQWAGDRYSVQIPLGKGEQDDSRGGDNSTGEAPPGVDSNNEYGTLADLYAGASPTSEPDKVLVAAYWHQVVKGEKELTSANLNKGLANLGHKITNINMKFDVLIKKKPQLALQLKKSGATKQARKKYKLTQAGINRAQKMLNN